MRIATKIAGGFAGVLLLTGVVGVIGWYGLEGYATGVVKAQRMSDLKADLYQAQVQISRFQRSGDSEALISAEERIGALTDRSDEGSESDSAQTSTVLDELRTYQAMLDRYSALYRENVKRWDAMTDTTSEIESSVEGIYDLHSERYEEALETMENAESSLEHVERLQGGAGKLIEAVLRARQSEADYQLSGKAEAKDAAKAAMKAIYLAALSMSKAAKGTVDDTSVKEISKTVIGYRKAFKAFFEALEEGGDIAGSKELLDRAAQGISTLAATVQKRQLETYRALKAQTNEARKLVAEAVSSNTGAMYTVGLLSELRLAQHEYRLTGDQATDERIGLIADAMKETLQGMVEDYPDQAAEMGSMLELMSAYRANYQAAKTSKADQAAALEAMRDVEARVVVIAKERAKEAAEEMSALHDLGRTAMLLFTVLAIAVGIFVSILTGRSIVRPLNALTSCIMRLAKGEAEVQIPGIDRRDEIGEMARSMGVIRETGETALRAQKTLDSTAGSLMMVDEQGLVVLANPALRRLASEVAGRVADEMPGFAASEIAGLPFDRFHNDPELGLEHLRQLSSTVVRWLKAGGRTFEIELNPIHNEDGGWIGTVVEWWDRTDRLVLEKEVDTVVAAAAAGDFSHRVDLAGKEGFMRKLAESINQLSVVVDQATGDLATMLETMAEGDLTRRMTTDYQGRFGELKESANRTADQLTGIVAEVQSTTMEVENAAAEISAGTEDLSDRTEQAASNLEETAAASEQMSANVKNNADHAKNAAQLAASTNQVASRGGQVVEQAVDAMSQIEKSAKRITDIIGVIDEIAFQTNLLALNASVEAARAGEAGKGFAVVAQEVRQLAQRSAKAASDIKTLIQDSNSQVQGGVELVNQAGEALSEILGSIGQVTSIVQEISSASQEQASGVQEINGSITSMDQMTQQNSALVEESAASARTLSDQAKKLADLMAFFKLDTDLAPTLAPIETKEPQASPPTADLVAADEADGWLQF